MIKLLIHMNFCMTCLSYLWKKCFMEFNVFMPVDFVKELETSFWDFVHKLFEEMILCHLRYGNNISSHAHYIMCIFMVQYP